MVNTRMLYVETKDIVEKAESLGSVKTFIKAVRGAGMEGLLKGSGPFTVFAPDDRAFYRLPAVMVNDLLKDRGQLEEFIKYHIIPDRVTSSDVRGTQEYLTLQGNNLVFSMRRGFMVNDLVVIEPDIECANGVLHLIDALLTTKRNSRLIK